MKYFFLMAGLLTANAVLAQFSPSEIRKHKISKITETQTSNSQETPYVVITWFDVNGYDTLISSGGSVIKNLFTYDRKNQPLRKQTYSADNKEIGISDYTYKADGSYEVRIQYLIDGNDGFEWYDKLGRLEKIQLPDGSKRFYEYNEKNKLINVMTMLSPQGNGEIVNYKYTYNAKGLLVKEVNNGINKWERTFNYNEKDLITTIDKVVTAKDVKSTVKTMLSYELMK